MLRDAIVSMGLGSLAMCAIVVAGCGGGGGTAPETSAIVEEQPAPAATAPAGASAADDEERLRAEFEARIAAFTVPDLPDRMDLDAAAIDAHLEASEVGFPGGIWRGAGPVALALSGFDRFFEQPQASFRVCIAAIPNLRIDDPAFARELMSVHVVAVRDRDGAALHEDPRFSPAAMRPQFVSRPFPHIFASASQTMAPTTLPERVASVEAVVRLRIPSRLMQDDHPIGADPLEIAVAGSSVTVERRSANELEWILRPDAPGIVAIQGLDAAGAVIAPSQWGGDPTEGAEERRWQATFSADVAALRVLHAPSFIERTLPVQLPLAIERVHIAAGDAGKDHDGGPLRLRLDELAFADASSTFTLHIFGDDDHVLEVQAFGADGGELSHSMTMGSGTRTHMQRHYTFDGGPIERVEVLVGQAR